MKQVLRVAVADDELIMRLYLEEILPEMGYKVVSVAENGAELMTQVRAHHPDLILTDIRMPVVDGIQAVQQICAETPLPVVFISGQDNRERAEQAAEKCVLVYLTKPVGQDEIRAAVESVVSQFKEFQVLHEEQPDLRKALADRREVERAKEILVRRDSLTRSEAFQRIHEMGRERHLSVVEIARQLMNDHA